MNFSYIVRVNENENTNHKKNNFEKKYIRNVLEVWLTGTFPPNSALIRLMILRKMALQTADVLATDVRVSSSAVPQHKAELIKSAYEGACSV